MKYQTKPGLTTVAIVAIVAGVLLAGGAAAYVATDGFSSDDSSQTAESDTADQAQDSQQLAASSDRELYEAAIAGGAQVRCDFVTEDGSTGVAYVDSETSMRVDVQTPEDGPAYFIRDGDFAYAWTGDSKEGFKINITEASQAASQYQSFGEENFEAEAEADTDTKVDCQRQSIDSDLLTPPAGITFQNFSQANIYQRP